MVNPTLYATSIQTYFDVEKKGKRNFGGNLLIFYWIRKTHYIFDMKVIFVLSDYFDNLFFREGMLLL